MSSGDETQTEAVYLAASAAESDFVEQLLDQAEIEYQLTPEPFLNHAESEVCLQGLLVRVPSSRAEEIRKVLIDRGLARGVLPRSDRSLPPR